MTHEIIGNLHVHTRYSDGHGRHEDVARAALKAGLDFVVVTDHNVWVSGMDDYYYLGSERVLLLTGEEVHDQSRKPQKNHLLIYEAQRELAQFAQRPQTLIDQAVESGGICFLAHPTDPAAPAFHEDDLSWVDWDVRGYHGLELWNFMSEFKSLLKNKPQALFYAFNPALIASGPFSETLSRWDQLLSEGRQVSAIGGSDAHGTPMNMGPIRRVIFPYDFLFQAVNTHVNIPEPLSGDIQRDRERIFTSVRRGQSFIGYDLPASTRGFRFNAQSEQGEVSMGESIKIRFGVTLQIRAPLPASIRLIHNGQEYKRWDATPTAVHTVNEPGAYRVEVHLPFRGRLRGWIYSNPIYLTN
jgi:hypothetical protein